MKKGYIIIVSLALFCAKMEAQWNQYLTNQTSIIDEVSVVNDNVAWITDQDAAQFSITTDGGNTWVTKKFPIGMPSVYIGTISALSATTAYTFVSFDTGMGIYKTTNSGDTWVKQTSGFSTNSYIDAIYFFNENDGVAIGDGLSNLNLEIYTTNDGGTTWTLVPATNFPTSTVDYSYNNSEVIKVHGNTIYVLEASGNILKSADKGLTWTLIKTPFNNAATMAYDFRDDNNGIVTNYTYKTNIADLYSTSDGGKNWVKGSSTNVYLRLKYIPSEKAYLSMHPDYGMTYSLDYGVTWIKHPSFQNVGVITAEVAPSGKIFMGGWKYMYNSTNFKGINPTLQQVVINDGTHMDLYFDRVLESTSAQYLGNYSITYKMKPDTSTHIYTYNIGIQSTTLDNTNKSLIRLVTTTNVPKDTLTFTVNNVKDLSGFPVINGSTTAVSTLINTSSQQISSSNIKVLLNSKSNEIKLSGFAGDALFNLFDLSGRIILSKKVTGNSSIPVGIFPSGVYLVKLTKTEWIVEQKIIKN